MSLNPTGGQSYGWNYTKPDQPNYTKTLVGTVQAIQEVQARKYKKDGVGDPDFWPEGNPKMNQRIALADPNGNLVTFTYQPASKKQKEEGTGVHMALFGLTGNTDMTNLVGKTIQIITKDPNEDWNGNVLQGMPTQYGSGFPRPFNVTEVQAGPFQLNSPLPNEFKIAEVLCNDGASGGQAVAPQNIQVPQQPVNQVQQVQQPVAQVQQPVVNTQPVVQDQMVQQQGIQPMQPQVPAGMDPQVAAAMQNMGAVNIQPVVDGGSIYDESIPF